MNKGIANFLKLLAIGFAVFYILMQLYSVFINPVSPDTEYAFSTFSGYETTGYIIRNEAVITNNASGSLSFSVEDGGRVAKGGTVATVYKNEQEADAKVKVEQLDERIAALETIQEYNDVNAADVPSLSSKVHTALISVLDGTQGGNVTSYNDGDTLLEFINRKQIVTGQISDFSAFIATLKSERDSLKASVSAPVGTLQSPESGYVVCSVDGYENSVSIDSLDTLTADSLGKISPSTPDKNAVCKIVSDYQWYIACEIPFDESLKLKVGDKVTINTTLVSSPELSATVRNINKQSVTGSAVVVFSCDTMNNELAAARFLEMTVVYSRHEGLKVDNRAIRKVDGVTGVYVLTASLVKFVPVNILWTGENFSIAERQASDSKVLRMYDEIIVKGKNLHDGKIIK